MKANETVQSVLDAWEVDSLVESLPVGDQELVQVYVGLVRSTRLLPPHKQKVDGFSVALV